MLVPRLHNTLKYISNNYNNDLTRPTFFPELFLCYRYFSDIFHFGKPSFIKFQVNYELLGP